DGPGHAPDEDHAAGALPPHEVARDLGGEEVGAVDVDLEEAAQAVRGVLLGGEVLGEAGGGDEVVDPGVDGEDLGDAGGDGGGVRDDGVVGCYKGCLTIPG